MYPVIRVQREQALPVVVERGRQLRQRPPAAKAVATPGGDAKACVRAITIASCARSRGSSTRS